MKSVYIETNGGPEVLQYSENFPEPTIKPNEVLVKVEATSLNRVDLHIRKGYPGLKLNFPHILGADISGIVWETGSEVKNFQKGDRVVAYPIVLPENLEPKFLGYEHLNDGWKYFGMHIPGSYCEFVAVPAKNLVHISPETDFARAATLPVAGLTAYHGLYTVAQLKEGDAFFLWGGASGLGTFAIQLAKLVGAKVIATVGKNYKKEILYSLGADYVFNHYEDDVVSEVKKIYPLGVDFCLDFVGRTTFEKSLALLRKNGTLLICGMITGAEVNFNLQQFYIRHLNIKGFYLGSPQEFSELVRLVDENKIKPYISQVFDLKDASKAHAFMENGEHIGKIVLKI